MRPRHPGLPSCMVLSFSLVLASHSLAAPALSQAAGWKVVGQIGGPTQAVAVQGKYAYVGVGPRLVVLDVSNPSAMREVGATAPFPQLVEGLAVSGALAYVAAGGAGLRIVDASDPARPTEVGAWDTRGYARAVAVAGTTVYLADGPYGLRVFDVSNPARPKEVGAVYVMNYAFGVAVAGRYAYVAAAGAGLLVADVSDPARPVGVSTLDTPGYAYGVAVADNVVYVADGWEGLKLVNVADPVRPVQVGSFKTLGWALGITVSGNLAYVADGFGGLRVIDVSTPALPRELGGYEALGGHARAVALSGKVAYVADRNWGLRALDVADPMRPAALGSYRPLSDAWGVVVAGRYAYVAATYYGLRIVDVSDPARPVEVGNYDADGDVRAVAVRGNYAYLAVPEGPTGLGLQIVDVSNPAAPKRAGFLPFTPDVVGDPLQGRPRDVKVVGDIVYVPDEVHLVLISVSDPSRPALISSTRIEPGECTLSVVVSGHLAYVAAQDVGLVVMDVSNPKAPIRLGTDQTPRLAQDVDVDGSRAFVVEGGFLRVVDVSDPRRPTTVGTFDTSGDPNGVTFAGSQVYVGNGGGGVLVVDVTDSSRPVAIGAFDTPGFARKAAVAGSHVYVADGMGGLLILEKIGSGGSVGLPTYVRQVEPNPAQLSNLPISRPVIRGQHMATLLPARDLPEASRLEVETTPAFPAAQAESPVAAAAKQADRRLSATACTVTSAADGGPGTLRWCLENTASGGTITFAQAIFPPTNPATIKLVNKLPPLAQGGLTIDASNAGVILDGVQLPEGTNGLVVTSDGNAVKGLQIVSFPGDAVVIRDGARKNIIGGNRTRGAGQMGEGNMLSRNWRALLIHGKGTDENVVIGNHFGIDVRGEHTLHNRNSCIAIGGGAQRNTVGGPGVGERNLIVGCGRDPWSVLIYGTGTTGNALIGNYIGTDGTGMRAFGAATMAIEKGAASNRIGGIAPGEGNLISGGWVGVSLGTGARGNTVAGNYIGTNATGTAALGNVYGIWIESSSGNVVRQNVISGNSGYGVVIITRRTEFNVIAGNLIGTDATGRVALPNGIGLSVGEGARFNRIGGTIPADRNVISGNAVFANVNIDGWGDDGNLILGNYIGVDITGSQPIGGAPAPAGGQHGINFSGSEGGTMVGGTTEAERNVISGNSANGIHMWHLGVEHTFIGGNLIGTDASGRGAIGNQRYGISVLGTNSNFIQGNAIAHNSDSGIWVNNYGFRTFTALRRNSIWGHAQKGITEVWGVEPMLPGPRIVAASTDTVWGTACPGCEVEIFSDDDDEGRIFEGSTVADNSGVFSFGKRGGLTGPNITATATDLEGNTSEFSQPRKMLKTAGPLFNVSAASYAGDFLAAESIVTAFGAGLATGTEAARSLPLPTSLAGTGVKVADSAGVERSAPLYFVSPTQVNYQIPPSTVLGPALVTVTNTSGATFAAGVVIVSVAPGLFSASGGGQGLAAANVLRVKADGSQTYEPVTQPIDLGPEGDQVYLLLYGTGIRRRSSLGAVTVSIGGTAATVSYAGPQPEYPGLDQVNVLLPRSLRGPGDLGVALTVEGKAANSVRVNVQ